MSFDKNGHGSFHQRSICMFFFVFFLRKINFESGYAQYSSIISWALFTCSNISQVHRKRSLNKAHFLTLIQQDLANSWRSGWLAWTLSAEWGKFQELRMVTVGQFHRQAFQHTHMSFEKGRWQSIWRSLNIRKTMIALSSQSKIQRYNFRAQLNPDR